MKFFLDTANLESIKQYAAWGMVDGVTTNPTLIAKEGVSLEKRIREIAKVVNGPISAEVIATDVKGMLAEGRRYAKWHKNVYVKVPCTPDGLQAVQVFKKAGVKTNVTLVFSAGQALLVAKAGAELVSPFIGRLDDVAEDGMALIAEIIEMYANYGFDTEVLVASVRHPRHVIDAARLGADIATMPPEILEKLVKHPLTDTGLAMFLADWEKVKGNSKLTYYDVRRHLRFSKSMYKPEVPAEARAYKICASRHGRSHLAVDRAARAANFPHGSWTTDPRPRWADCKDTLAIASSYRTIPKKSLTA